MTAHYIIQSVFIILGLLSIMAASLNWDWFFKENNSQFIVSNVGRKQARLFYAAIGCVMIATGIFFFLNTINPPVS